MFKEFIIGFSYVLFYFIINAGCALMFRYYIRVPKEVFRKSLHMILLLSLHVFLFAFDTWWLSGLATILIIVLAYPIIRLGEKVAGFSEFVTEQKKGELKKSLIVVFLMFLLMISIGWGWLGKRWLILACVYAWGFGDAAAALIGKKYGKHHFNGKFFTPNKTYEGTFAMFIVSFIAVFIVLMFSGETTLIQSFFISFVTAFVCTGVELQTSNGLDTITCPIAAATVILPLVHLFRVG